MRNLAHVAFALLLLLLPTVVGGCRSTAPTGPSAAGNSAQAEIESLLDDLYVAFCFDAEEQPGWAGMRALFAEGAAFASPISAGGPAKVQDTEAFLSDFYTWATHSAESRTGFHERILQTRIEVFENIAYASVTFEGFVPGEGEARTLGVDSIQLVRDKGTWKLMSFATQYAGPGVSVPPRYLDGQDS